MNFFRFFIFLILLNFSAKSSHLPKGQELTYKHIAGLNYEITYRLFMDCRSELSPTDTLRNIIIQSSCFSPIHIELKLVSGYPISLDENCYSALGQCNSSGIPGATEYKYTDTITLPGICQDWQFTRSECCMVTYNSNIYNPSASMTTEFFSMAFLNNSISNLNSSVQFLIDPVYKTCIGEDICINYNAWDPDGDSLVYEMIPMNFASGDSLTYDTGFYSKQPLSTFIPIQFNEATGSLCFRPINQEMTYWNLRVSEYRNHLLIGFAEREMMLSSELCNNQEPVLSGLNASTNYSATLIYGQNYCFNIIANDNDVLDSTFISGSYFPSGMSATLIPGQNQSVILCWSPILQDVKTQPYVIILNARDNSCPSYGTNSSEYELTVAMSLSSSEIKQLYKSFEVFPNPASGEFKIMLQNFNFPCKLNMEDLSGRHTFEKIIYSQEALLSPDISNGIYFVKIVDNEYPTLVKRIIYSR